MVRFRGLRLDIVTFRRLGIAGIFLALPVFLNSFSFSTTGSPPPPLVQLQVQTNDTTKPVLPAKISVDSLRSDSTYRARYYESVHIRRDTLGVLRDSLGFMVDTLKLFAEIGGKIDTTWVVYLDSTVRLQQYVYKRADQPAVAVFPRNRSSYILDTRSPAYQREISLDSTGQYVTVREKVNGVDVKVPVTIALDQYIHQRYEEEKLNNWRTFTRDYTIKGGQDELGGLLSNFTNIDIPVPANPILSIFGKPVINIHTSGQIDIRAGFRSVKSDQTSLNTIDVSRNEPDFNQQVQINVSGTVGDKLNILADWNTQRTFEYENSLKIKYTGYEDEIVQSVEAGNVSLQTPSLVGGGQALFGLKTKLQLGPLSVTALLSQKKGQTKELTATGGQQSNTQDIRPQAYSTSYYFVDTLYRSYWAPLHETISPSLTFEMEDNQIIQLDLWMSVPSSSSNVSKTFKAHAYIDLPSRAPSEKYLPNVADSLGQHPGESYTGNFIQLEPGKDYKFSFSDPRQVNGGYIVLNTSIPDEQALAVTYTVLGHGHPRSFGTKNQTFNEPMSDGYHLLKLIKPPGLVSQPGYRTAWNLQLKNIYSLGGRDLKPEGFNFQIFRQTEASDVDQINGENLLKVLKLDRFDATLQPKPDNVFDFIPGLTIDIERAELIFPTLRPFDSTISEYFKLAGKPLTSDSLLFGDVYDTTYTAAQTNTLKNRYLLRVQASTGTSSKYSLGFNVVEGSVHVILDGTELQQNTDYTVDYIIGEVNIKRPEAALPGHSVQVKFEQNDLFQLASKTLMGARAELSLFPNTALGFTAMNLNQATLSDKVRLGEEPTNNLILGTDLSTSMNLPFLTNLIDALPFIRTREMSTLRLSGEGAYSLPNPNTKTSTLTGDGNASIAYIDDFEGARQTVSIDIAFTNWRIASPPKYTLLNGAISDTSVSYSRARLWWYNNPQGYENVLVTDIWPYRSVQRGQEFVYPLYLQYSPWNRGMYNYSPKLDSTLNRKDDVKRAQNWNGVMRYVGTYAGSLLDKNITFLEVWAQLYDRSTPDRRPGNLNNVRHGKLFIDLGKISEDVIPNKELNSEDILHTANNPYGIPRGVADNENDRGLDTLFDEQEQTVYANFLNSNRDANSLTGYDQDINPGDPSGDDYAYTNQSIDFSKINGLEGNMNIRRDPDTEDLNRSGGVDPENEYVEYEIPLDSVYYDSTQNLVQNPYIVGGNKATGWYQLRIPLTGPNRVIGGLTTEATLANVKYMRMWLSGFNDSVIVRIAELNLVGNQWLQSIAHDSILALSVVNLEDNPEYNTPDYQNLGIVRERDKTQPDQNILANEQSLSLILNGLQADSSREVYKTFPVRPLDIFNYKQVKMFVHGDPTFIPYSESSHTAEVYLRFGSDSLNYYEYRQPVWRDWDPHNELKIPLDALTAIKSARDSINVAYSFPAENGIPFSTYGIRGSPSLRRVQYIVIGVKNTGKFGSQPIYGQIWVNELRVIDVNNTPGFAYHFETQVKLADLGTASFNYSRTDPNFHALDARFGDQLDHRNWAVNANVELARFLPESWAGSQISTSASHGESMVLPRYLPNTDVVVAEAARVAEAKKLASPNGSGGGADSVTTVSQTMQTTDSYSLSSFHLAPPSQFFLIRDILARITLSFNYNKSKFRDPVTEVRSAWSWNSSASYGLSLGTEGFFQPFKSLFSWIPILKEYKDWKIYYQPFQSFQARIGAQRSRQYEQSRLVNSDPRDTRNFGVSKSLGFQWKLTEGGLTGLAGDYGLTIDRNLNELDNDSVGRDFSSLLHSILIGGQDNRYSQRVTFNLRPNLPNIFNVKQYFDLTAAYGVNYGWQNTFQKGDLGQDIGKGAGFDNNITLGMNIKLKSIFDPLFQQSTEQPDPADTSKGKTGRKKSVLNMIKTIGTIFIKVPFLDFETIAFQFSEQNRASSNGVVGATGFLNFWGRLPFQEPVLEWGPTRMYQLGIITDPSGKLHYAPTSTFPFVGWDTEHGPRAPEARLTDQFNQANSFAIRTNRGLWEGASLEVNWKVGWQNSKQTTFNTDATGLRIDTTSTFTTAGSVERSYLTIPPVFFFKVFNSSLENVGKKYDKLILDGAQPAEAATQAFEQGLEALPFMTKIFGSFWPRANWTIHWDGIEKIGGISSVVDRLSLEHAYSSTFRKDFVGTVDGSEVTNAERTIYGFAPLLGLTATFKEVWKGSLQGSVRYNTSTAYDLTVSTQQIAETFTQEMSLSFTYQRRGFNLPLFGLNLKNDVEFNLTFSEAKNSRKNYNPSDLSKDQDGTSLDGNTRTTLEPRMKYNLSSQVSASLFYRYTRIAPDASSTVYGTTTNEAGVDVHIAIR